MVRSSFPDHKVEIKKADLTRGTYPYVKIVFRISNQDGSFISTYYIVNKVRKTRMIMVHNPDSLDFEETIKYIE